MCLGLNALLITAHTPPLPVSRLFSSPPQKGKEGKKEEFFLQISAAFHGAFADIDHLYIVNFSMLKTLLVGRSFN